MTDEADVRSRGRAVSAVSAPPRTQADTVAAEFMARLAPLVGRLVAVQEGEGFTEYVRRVGQEASSAQRAMVATHVLKVSRDLRGEAQAEKSAWIAAARLAFDPGPRQPCVICGLYEGVTEAHHSVPLAAQYDAGAPEPLQVHDWLCPTHHAALHLCIQALLANRMATIAGMPPAEADALDRLGVKFVGLLTSLPSWHAVDKGRAR